MLFRSLKDYLGGKADFLAVGQDVVVKVEIVPVEHQGIVCQKLHGYFPVFFQRIALGHDYAHFIFRKEEGFEILVGDGADNAYVDDAFLYG